MAQTPFLYPHLTSCLEAKYKLSDCFENYLLMYRLSKKVLEAGDGVQFKSDFDLAEYLRGSLVVVLTWLSPLSIIISLFALKRVRESLSYL